MTYGNYIVLDAARLGDMMDEVKKIEPENESFYKTKDDQLLQTVAPYLFAFSENTPLFKFYFDNGWGNSWGILVSSSVRFTDIYKHLRRFLVVKTEDGAELYFRFYDPRVLRIFLPTCDMQQLFEFFGPVDYFFVEDENKELAIKFWLENGKLKSKQFPIKGILPLLNKQIEPAIANTETNDKITLNANIIKNPPQPLPNKPKPNSSKPKWDMFN